MVEMVPTVVEKVEHDQRVTAKRSRTGKNRLGRLNWTELEFGRRSWRVGW